MKIEEKLLTVNPYSRPGTSIGAIEKIVVHWVGNAGSTAIANRNYFESLKDRKKYASAHYIVGLEGEILLCVPETEVAYHANSANGYSIGIENCHPDWTGKFSAKTTESLIQLLVHLCRKYALNPLTDIIRHYDVTGKICPKYFVENPKEWESFKAQVNERLKGAEEVVTKTKIKLNGVIKEVHVIHKDGNNYIKLQDMRDNQINVAYDSKNKLPIVEVKA